MNKNQIKYIHCRAFEAFFESLDAWKKISHILKFSGNITQQEYDMILKGVYADICIPLWASAALGEDHPLLDETTWKMIRFFKMIFNLAGNLLINQHSDINNTVRLLKDESLCEMIIVSDIFMTPSARFADILLPAPSVLESNNITAPWNNEGDYLLSNSRAAEPLFGAIPDYDWIRMIARELGIEQEFTQGFETTEQWLEYLYQEHRKVEPELPAVPAYVACVDGPHDAGKYPLQLIGYHTKRRCHSIHDNNSWMVEVDPPAPLAKGNPQHTNLVEVKKCNTIVLNI